MNVVDLFAGPGGWDIAAVELGIDPLGVELDDAACATRAAAGLRTTQADVASLNPDDYAPCDGLIASPPCQAFSMAGKGAGRAAISAYLAVIGWMSSGRRLNSDYLAEQCSDERAHLVLEPLRWTLALHPRWVACEQVEPVLPVWEVMAAALREHGYFTWTGVLSAEQYGVPQTRKRAMLLASLDGPVGAPPATHQRYIAPRQRAEATESLFEVPEPERIVAPEDRGLLPWVSMAEALGWDDGSTPSPAPTVTGGGAAQGGVEVFASKASRARASRAMPFYYRNGNQPNAARRREDEPAPTLHFGHALNSGVEWTTTPEEIWRPSKLVDTGCTRGEGEVSPTSDRVRPVDAPSPALTTRADHMEWNDEPLAACGCLLGVVDANRFCACCEAHLGDPEGLYAVQGDGTHRFTDCPSFVAPTSYNSRDQRDTRTGSPVPARQRSVDESAPTIAGESRNDSWTRARPAKTLTSHGLIPAPGQSGFNAEMGREGWEWDRPATTVNGDPRVAEPGWRGAPRDYDGDGNYIGKRSMDNAVRVSIAEALVLQSFPPDYPVQGTKTAQFRQVGDAVPPLLAWHVLRAVVPLEAPVAA